MKANSNLAILDMLARQGAGFDIVSGGELLRVIAAGGDPGKVIFSGVGKTAAEIGWRWKRASSASTSSRSRNCTASTRSPAAWASARRCRCA
jgi:diaminopimelate decarboxylase